MILLVDEKSRYTLERYLSRSDPYACRILSQLLAYGTDARFLEHWIQVYNDKPTAALSRLDGNMTVYCESDNDELYEFIGAVGYSSILADGNILPRYKGKETVLKYSHGMEAYKQELVHVDSAPTVREIYPILALCRGEGFDVPDFDSFYPDMSHRLRHGLARIFAVKVDGRAVSCCMTSAETETCAIISGVATMPNMRGRGYASLLVSKTVEALSPKDIYLFCDKALAGFYNRLGFYDNSFLAEKSNNFF